MMIFPSSEKDEEGKSETAYFLGMRTSVTTLGQREGVRSHKQKTMDIYHAYRRQPLPQSLGRSPSKIVLEEFDIDGPDFKKKR
eukprot:scaffold35002_cov160-Amphora_coffeaeformis.AAC.2